jgi:hypothetical protein
MVTDTLIISGFSLQADLNRIGQLTFLFPSNWATGLNLRFAPVAIAHFYRVGTAQHPAGDARTSLLAGDIGVFKAEMIAELNPRLSRSSGEASGASCISPKYLSRSA